METAILWHTGPLIDDVEVAQVHDLAAAAERVDGVAPLSEQPLLNLREASDDVVHLLTWMQGALAGYAQVERRGDAASAELVVHPAHRRHGLGYHLLASATARAAEPAGHGEHAEPAELTADLAAEPADAPDGEPGTDPGGEPGGGPTGDPAGLGEPAAPAALRVWAHGDLPPARALAAKAGFVVVRELLRLARPLAGADEHPVPPLPAGLGLRTFVPGSDDAAWLRLNARAFADHPEQGRTTLADLHARTQEDWFDPTGFYLLERTAGPGSGELVGFVWTKVPAADPPGGPRTGELYVVGVDPAAQGEGLGRLLTAVGLAHLARVGVREAELYVDGENTAAVRTYERAGFERRAVDVQYAPSDA